MQSRTLAPPSAGLKDRRSFAGGTAGNELLTIATGAVLIVLLAVIGLTILRIHGLLSVHLFVGLVLVGPLVLKMASTGYRFVRYYGGVPAYRRKGPPPHELRLLAPLVVLSTVAVFGTGVALLLVGPNGRGTLTLAHKASFIVWLAATALHVLGHLVDLPRSLRADRRGERPWDDRGSGRGARALAVAGALALGLVLALLAESRFSAWTSSHAQFHLH